MDRTLLNSSSREIIQQFIHSVVQSHEIATGLKKLTSHGQIVDPHRNGAHTPEAYARHDAERRWRAGAAERRARSGP